MTPERWAAIEGFPLYEVSSLGRVRSLTRIFERPKTRGHLEERPSGCQVIKWSGRILRGWLRRRKTRPVAMFVALRRDGQTFQVRLHRLVLEAFAGPCPAGMEGCHNDGNPRNNALSNLRWDTPLANQLDSVRHGTKARPPLHFGEAHPNSRLTDAEVEAIKSHQARRGLHAQLAREFNVSQTTIGRIRTQRQRVLGAA